MTQNSRTTFWYESRDFDLMKIKVVFLSPTPAPTFGRVIGDGVVYGEADERLEV